MKMYTIKKLFKLYILCTLFTLQSYAQAEIKITYYIPDASGSPIAATDEQGNIKWRKHYYPFGAEISTESDQIKSTNNNIGYTGHVHDRSTGLTYMRARYYDPVVGRFMGMDPAGVNPNDPRTFNRFAYANNSPYRYTDPDGRNARLIIQGPFWVGTRIGAGINYGIQAATGASLGALIYEAVNNENAGDIPATKENKGQNKPEVGSCPDCGGDTSKKPGKIASKQGLKPKEVKDKIHGLKQDAKINGNPDVEVCNNCGEVFPQTSGGGLGDSIGNIDESF